MMSNGCEQKKSENVFLLSVFHHYDVVYFNLALPPFRLILRSNEISRSEC
jgi:hypothetical protein